MKGAENSSGEFRSAAIDVSAVSKRFGAIRALSDISLSISPGEVHSFVGENGAGKSTLLGMMAGRLAPDRGTVRFFGQPIKGGSPREARAHGVSAIYQELTMIPALTPVSNVYLGSTPASFGVVRRRQMRNSFDALCDEFGVSIDPDVRTDTLSMADQQMLEIMRAFRSGARIILYDEPTASLGPSERDKLLSSVEKLRSRGVTQVFVSHHLEECMDISDRLTVFREGRIVSSRLRSEWSKQSLVNSMLGQEFKHTLESRPARPGQPPKDLYKVRDLAVPKALRPTDLTIRSGEVLGVAGLVGSGRSTLLRALAGFDRASGKISIEGTEKPIPHSVRQARRLGIALVPEDRKGMGLMLGQSSAANVVVADLPGAGASGIVTPRGMIEHASRAMQGYGFDRRRLATKAQYLSGGNQQKLMLGRWRFATPRLLLVDEPTRGIDIGSKTEILRDLRAAAIERGLAVVIVSSEIEEVIAVSDRIVVMRDGAIVGEVDCHTSEATPESLLGIAFDVTKPQEEKLQRELE